MTIYIIGERNEKNAVIFDFAKENGMTTECSGYESLSLAFEKANGYPTVILDLSEAALPASRLEPELESFLNSYNGSFVVYAPNLPYDNPLSELCERLGAKNVVRDLMSAKAKVKFKEYILGKAKAPEPENVRRGISFRSRRSPEPVESYSHEEYTNEPQMITHPRNEEHRSENNTAKSNITITKKIGIIGVLPRIGTTTQAILLTEFLTSVGESVCYIQEHESNFIRYMENYFTDVSKDKAKGCIMYEGLSFFSDRNLVYSQNFNYHVIDYGYWKDMHSMPTDFFNNDIRILVCGGTAEEVDALTSIRRMIYRDNGLEYIFSFIADYEKDDILDMMADRSDKVHFASYNPDCYKGTAESRRMCAEILNMTHLLDEGKKKGRGLFRKRKGE